MDTVLYAFGTIALVGGILWLCLKRFLGDQTAKDAVKGTKIALLLSLAGSVVFYNKSPFPFYAEVTPSATILYALTILMLLMWLSLSYRWFTTTELKPFRLCLSALTAAFATRLILTAVRPEIFYTAQILLSCVTYGLLRFNQETEILHPVSRRYAASALFFLLWAGVALLVFGPENWNMADMADRLATAPHIVAIFVTAGLLGSILFMLGAAPFHFWLTDISAPAVLPVAAYLQIVMFFVLWGSFFRFHTHIPQEMVATCCNVYALFGALSMIIGAIGAHTIRNIKKILAYVNLFYTGLFLLIFSSADERVFETAFVLMPIYVTAFSALYIALYGFKSNREYISNLSMLAGVASVRPILALMMSLALLVLSGVVPLTGFVGLFGVLSLWAENGDFWKTALTLSAFLIFVPACLRFIHTMYFLARSVEYDRTDRTIYLWLAVAVILLAVMLLKPQVLTESATLFLNMAEEQI